MRNFMLRRINNKALDIFRSCGWRILNWKYQFLLRRLCLSHTLPTGIRVEITSMADWAIYNDIFVSGEYDLAIRTALERSAGTCRILDLGANVGLFAKRAIHIRREAFPHVPLEIACVEGLPHTYSELQRQFPQLLQHESVRLHHGLAGQRNGTAVLQPNPFHAMTGLAKHSHKRGGIEVNFLDLSQVTSGWDTIDLLKCDIEGAEGLVIDNYPDLLQRTKLAIFEFHLDRVDRNRYAAQIVDCGLDARVILHGNEYISVEMFRRK